MKHFANVLKTALGVAASFCLANSAFADDPCGLESWKLS